MRRECFCVLGFFCLLGRERKVLVFLGKGNMISWYHSKMGRRGALTSLISTTLVLYTSSFLFYRLQKLHNGFPSHLNWLLSSSTVTQRSSTPKTTFPHTVEQKKHWNSQNCHQFNTISQEWFFVKGRWMIAIKLVSLVEQDSPAPPSKQVWGERARHNEMK